jgi:proline racemase
VKRYMSWADKRGIGYLAWAWWVLRNKRCNQLSVLANASGKPKSPNGTALKAHLAALAARSGRGS